MADEQQRHAGGRPTILTADLQNEIVEALKTGLPIKLTCEYVGIGERTFYDWQAQIPQFAQAVRQARVGGAMEMLREVRKAAPTDWRAAAEALRLAFPQEFAKRIGSAELKDHERRQIAEEVADAIASELLAGLEESGLSDQQHDRIRERLAKVVERGHAA